MSTTDEAVAAKKDRSPSYPFISLRVAIERLVALDEKFKRHSAPADKAGIAWGLKETSSQAQQTLAALKSFGLVTYEGIGNKRLVKLTDDARNYLRAQQDTIKAQLLRRFALNPKPFAKYWDDWRDDRPIDDICLDTLVLHDGFTQSAASTFLRVYDETVAYARLGQGSTRAAAENTNNSEADIDRQIDKTPTVPKVGDLVQWESGGQEQFDEPRRVRAITEANDSWWVFVDGSETGIPALEVSIRTTAKVMNPASNSVLPPTLIEVKTSAEREWLRGPLSKETSYRLIVTGNLGPREIGKLIKLLEAQKMVLDDDNDGLDD